VVVPAGSASWTSTLIITKAIALQGQTPITGSPGTGVRTVTDRTIVADDIGQRTGAAPPIIRPQLGSSNTATFRLTGFTFRKGAATIIANNGAVRLEGTYPYTRIDHCHFDGLYQNPYLRSAGQIYGVVDHCVLDISVPTIETFEVKHDGWGGKANGDGSWADLPYYGSSKFWFIEDCTFNKIGDISAGGLDCYAGGRFVCRHNYFYIP
jgi:hypothetical protein